MIRIHYVAELESVRRNPVDMGATTLTLFDEAVSIVSEPNPQAPVARDARFVTRVLDAIVDLELIADYSYEIGTLVSGMLRQIPLQVLSHISAVAKRVRGGVG